MTNPTDSSKEIEIPEEFYDWARNEAAKISHWNDKTDRAVHMAEATYRHLHPSPSGWRDELIAALEKYNELLSDELSELVSLAAVHGWRSTRFEEGVRQRAEIEILKAKIASAPIPGDK